MRKLLVGLGLVIMCVNTHAQDLAFSQFYEMPLLRNPALAGVFEGDIRMTGAFRNQWPSVTVPFRTGAASVEVKFPIGDWNDYLTVGLQATHDIAGDIKLKRTQVIPTINYHKSLSSERNDYLSLAFSSGLVTSQFDPTKLKMDNQYINGAYNPNAPSQVFTRTGINYWDLSTGLTYSSGFGEDARYYVGATLFHANKPKVGFYTNSVESELNYKWGLNAGLNMPTSDNNKLLLFADYFKQGGHAMFSGGAMYGVEISPDYYTDEENNVAFYLGAFYRWNDAFIPVAKIDFYKLSLGISYDVNVSKLKSASQFQGGMEFTLSYRAKLNNRSYELDKVRCTF